MQQKENGDLMDSELSSLYPDDNGQTGNQACQQQQTHTHIRKHAFKHIYNFMALLISFYFEYFRFGMMISWNLYLEMSPSQWISNLARIEKFYSNQ